MISASASAPLLCAPYDRVRQKVLLTDDDPAHRVFYEHLGYHDVNEHPGGSLRAFVRFDD